MKPRLLTMQIPFQCKERPLAERENNHKLNPRRRKGDFIGPMKN